MFFFQGFPADFLRKIREDVVRKCCQGCKTISNNPLVIIAKILVCYIVRIGHSCIYFFLNNFNSKNPIREFPLVLEPKKEWQDRRSWKSKYVRYFIIVTWFSLPLSLNKQKTTSPTFILWHFLISFIIYFRLVN